MARTDITMNASLGEVVTTTGLSGRAFHPFRLLAEQDGQRVRGEITVPANFAVRRPGQGIPVRIPYTPLYKELSVRLRLDNGTGHPEYVVNPTDNGVWFPVLVQDSEGAMRVIRLSEYETINDEGCYQLVMQEGHLVLFSGHATDLEIGAAKYQNEVFLLKAMPGNLYQHPTTGVGLIDFLHGNFENNNLAARLQSEFRGDNMVIINAYMDSVTGELLLETQEKEEHNG
jgi:hypothetical protein